MKLHLNIGKFLLKKIKFLAPIGLSEDLAFLDSRHDSHLSLLSGHCFSRKDTRRILEGYHSTLILSLASLFFSLILVT